MHELPPSKLDNKPNKTADGWWRFIYAKSFHQGLIIGIGSLLCLLIFLVTVTPKRYNLSVGMVPNKPSPPTGRREVTTLRNREQAANAVTPIYHFQEGVADKVMLNLDSVYAQMLAVRQFAQWLRTMASTECTRKKNSRQRIIFQSGAHGRTSNRYPDEHTGRPV